MHLLDINILIALADAEHEHHERAESFFLVNCGTGWATCPITENGFVRIISQPSYPKGPGSTEEARNILRDLCSKEGHRFWHDDLSIRSFGPLPIAKHLTDHYLLCLALQRGGKLATLDTRIDASLVDGGVDAYVVI